MAWSFALIAVLALGSSGSGGATAAQAQAQEHHAGIVIQFSDGSVKTYCIPFTGDSITGLDLLLKTGLQVEYEAYGGMGGLICKIGPDGCTYPAQPCVCQSYGPGGVYWSYHHLKNGKWQTSVGGASTYKVHDGDVDGWAWSDGKPPALVPSFDQLCTQPVVAPTNTPLHPKPTATRTSTRLPTPKPTPTRTPRPRPTFTVTPTRITSQATPVPTVTDLVAPSLPATETPRPTATDTSTATPTAATAATPTASPTGTGTATPVPATDTPTPTPQPSGAPDNPEDRARTVGIILGAAVALGFILWRVAVGVAAARVRRSGAEDRDAE